MPGWNPFATIFGGLGPNFGMMGGQPIPPSPPALDRYTPLGFGQIFGGGNDLDLQNAAAALRNQSAAAPAPRDPALPAGVNLTGGAPVRAPGMNDAAYLTAVHPHMTGTNIPEPPNPYDVNPGDWVRDVTLGSLDVEGKPNGLQHFADQAPSIAYVTPEAAQRAAAPFGGQVNTMNPDRGPFGTLSSPQYTVSFAGQPNYGGVRDDAGNGIEPTGIDAGQIAFWLARGDSEEEIKRRLGLIPQGNYGRF